MFEIKLKTDNINETTTVNTISEMKEELEGYTGMLSADITVTENGEVVYRKPKGVYYAIKNYYKIV